MFISRKSHNLIVEELRNQIKELKAERDFYRKAWTRSKGREYVEPQPQPSLPFEPPKTEPPQIVLQPPAFDADWSDDDRDMFRDWAAVNVPQGIDAKDEWQRKYGGRSPLLALSV